MSLKEINYLFLVLALVAEIIGTIGGFGSSVFFVPIANIYFDFNTVLGLTAMFHVASNLSKIALFRSGFDWKLILNLGIPAVLFVILGGVLTNYFQSKYLEIFLGIFLVALSLLFLIKKNLIVKATRRNAILGGGLSGFFAGLLGTGGAVRGLTMAAFNLEKSIFIATSAAIDFCVDFSRLIVYAINGFIQFEYIYYIPFLIIIGWTGTWIGKKILARIPQKRFKKISLILILLIGIFTVIQTLINTN